MRRFKRHNFLTNFLRITGSQQINLYSLNIKFQEKIFTNKKVIKLWNFGNFGLPKIIPKSLVTLRFSKVSLHELKGICKCFQIRYWPNFYVDPTYSNTCFFKVGKWRVLLQGTVRSGAKKKSDILFCLLLDNNSPQDNFIEQEVLTICFKL